MSNQAKKVSDKLVWSDIETTGTKHHDIMLEIAVIVTDNDLNVLGACQSHVTDCDPSNLFRDDQDPPDNMGAIPCWSHHFDSGLVDELIFEFNKRKIGGAALLKNLHLTPSVVERAIIEMLAELGIHEDLDPKPPLCGNSVHFDRRFLMRDMPNLMKRIHYRNIDCSGIRECARRWAPDLEIPEFESGHRAKDDLMNSINLLRFFRKSGFLGV